MILSTVSFLLLIKLADLRLCTIPFHFFFFLFLLSLCLFGTFLFCPMSYGRFIWLVQASSICIIYLDRIQDYQMIVFFSPSLSTSGITGMVTYSTVQYTVLHILPKH